jgi:UDP-N-acetyl-D-mannosaminuronate dehydrogenase
VAEATFEPTSHMLRLDEPDAVLICVPTPLSESRDPDLGFVERTARQIAAALRPRQLVILESTTYPGTTREVVLPILATSGLRVGRDFFLAYSPEREDPGNAVYSAEKIPKVVGGIDLKSGELAALLYRQAVAEVVPVADCETAEACKILENTYRAVNIAMVNELAGEINTGMPHYVVRRVMEALNHAGKPLRGSRVLILGVAYKRDVDDPRESPAFRLMELLGQGGAILSYHDPHIPRLPVMRHYEVPELASTPLSAELLAAQDCVLVVTDHSSYDWGFLVRHAPLLIDTRNATRDVRQGREKIWKA